MAEPPKEPRTRKSAWLVDMGYVVKAARRSGLKLDYVAGQELLSQRFGEAKVFLFNSYDAAFGMPPGLKAFYHAMEQRGMTVCLHPMTGNTAAGDHRQRRVDVDFAAHAVWQASLPEIDTVILTSGDQDMIPAAKLCQEKFDAHLVLLTYRDAVSHALVALADEHLLIEDHRGRIDR